MPRRAQVLSIHPVTVQDRLELQHLGNNSDTYKKNLVPVMTSALLAKGPQAAEGSTKQPIQVCPVWFFVFSLKPQIFLAVTGNEDQMNTPPPVPFSGLHIIFSSPGHSSRAIPEVSLTHRVASCFPGRPKQDQLCSPSGFGAPNTPTESRWGPTVVIRAPRCREVPEVHPELSGAKGWSVLLHCRGSQQGGHHVLLGRLRAVPLTGSIPTDLPPRPSVKLPSGKLASRGAQSQPWERRAPASAVSVPPPNPSLVSVPPEGRSEGPKRGTHFLPALPSLELPHSFRGFFANHLQIGLMSHRAEQR